MYYKQIDKKIIKAIIFLGLILLFSCLIYKEDVYAWDWDGYYSGINYEEYNGDGTTDYRAHFGYRFTSNSGQLYINFIDSYTGSTLSSYKLDVWGDATGLASYGWNYISAPSYINMAISRTGGQDLGINFTNGSHVSTSLIMIDSRSPTDGMPYKQRFEAPLRYNIPTGYTTIPTGWNSNNQGSLSLNENRYQSNGGRGGAIRQFMFTRNGRYDYWCHVPDPNHSTLTNSSFILTGALTSDLGLSTNFAGFYTTTSKTLNIYLERTPYGLTVYPNGGTWKSSTSNQTIMNKWGTTISVPNPVAPSGYVVNLNANGGTGNSTKTATRVFTGWYQTGIGTLSGTNFTYGQGNKTLIANYSTNAITLPTLTRSGWQHLGWSTNQNATSATYANGSSYTPTGNVTLYAIWKKDIKITYNANGGTGTPPIDTKSIYNRTTSTSFTISNTIPTKNGYEFIGWGTANNQTTKTYSPGQNITLSDNLTVYALWKKDITITYDANGGIGAPIAETKTVYNSVTSASFVISNTEPTKAAYLFLGWSTDPLAIEATYLPGQTYIFTTSTTLYAVWQQAFNIEANITRILSPHDPVFRRGESGILHIKSYGYTDKITVTFPTSELSSKYNTEYTIIPSGDEKEFEIQFMIPLYEEERSYEVTVTAYMGAESKTVYPGYVVSGTVLDQIKTRIR